MDNGNPLLQIVALLVFAGITISIVSWVVSRIANSNWVKARRSPQDQTIKKTVSPAQVLTDEEFVPDAVAGLVKSKKTPEAGESSAMDQVLVSQLVSRLTQELALNRDELTKIKWACRAVALGIAILILVALDKQ